MKYFEMHFKINCLVLACLGVEIAGLGVTVGCHRYWTHKTFKATLPLQIILMVLQTAAIQYPIFKWCRVSENESKFFASFNQAF